MFTLTETEIDTENEINKMAAVSHHIAVSMQYEHLHTILYKPFLSVSVSVMVFVSVNSPLLFDA